MLNVAILSIKFIGSLTTYPWLCQQNKKRTETKERRRRKVGENERRMEERRIGLEIESFPHYKIGGYAR